jgi:hypothetical protein
MVPPSRNALSTRSPLLHAASRIVKEAPTFAGASFCYRSSGAMRRSNSPRNDRKSVCTTRSSVSIFSTRPSRLPSRRSTLPKPERISFRSEEVSLRNSLRREDVSPRFAPTSTEIMSSRCRICACISLSIRPQSFVAVPRQARDDKWGQNVRTGSRLRGRRLRRSRRMVSHRCVRGRRSVRRVR